MLKQFYFKTIQFITKIAPFQTIQFAKVHSLNVKTVLFQAIQFSISTIRLFSVISRIIIGWGSYRCIQQFQPTGQRNNCKNRLYNFPVLLSGEQITGLQTSYQKERKAQFTANPTPVTVSFVSYLFRVIRALDRLLYRSGSDIYPP